MSLPRVWFWKPEWYWFGWERCWVDADRTDERRQPMRETKAMVAKCEHGSIYAAAIYGPGTHSTKQEAVRFVSEALRDSDSIVETTSGEIRLSQEHRCWTAETVRKVTVE